MSGAAIGTPSARPAGGLAARLIRGVGQAAAWLLLPLVLVTFTVVLLRYGFNLGWVWLQESVTFLHAAVFMLAAAWTWQEDGHVRVDILYRDRSPRHKSWVDLAGTVLFVVPVCVYLLVVGWDYVAASWALKEGSNQAGGLPGVWLLKSLVIALPVLLLVQAGCWITQCTMSIAGRNSRSAE